jgi:diphosphoinositol-polyphosphate diphosphatase
MNTEREVTPPLEQQTVVQEFTDYTKKKRHGHGNDVVDENDVRQVAGCLPLDIKNHRVLLISSRKKNNAWVLVNDFFSFSKTKTDLSLYP